MAPRKPNSPENHLAHDAHDHSHAPLDHSSTRHKLTTHYLELAGIEDHSTGVRTITDKHGVKHKLEITSDHHVHYRNMDISREKIVRRDGSHTTTIDRLHGIITADTPDYHFKQVGRGAGAERTLKVFEDSFTYSHNKVLERGPDGQPVMELTRTGLDNYTPDGKKISYLTSETFEAAQAKDQHASAAFVDRQGHIYVPLHDGSIVQFLPDGNLAVRAQGFHDGNWHHLTVDQLPPELKKRLSGHIFELENGLQMDLNKHHLIERGRQQFVVIEQRLDGQPILHARNHQDIVLSDGKFMITDRDHPGHRFSWDPRTGVFQAWTSQNGQETCIATITPDSAAFSDGSAVSVNGTVMFQNADGTCDYVAPDGAVAFADGTSISAGGSIVTADGHSFNAFGSGPDSPESAASVTTSAINIVNEVMNKGSTITFSDVGLLISGECSVRSIMHFYMGNGNTAMVAQLMNTLGQLDAALAYALPRAQVCQIANRMGQFDLGLINQMGDKLVDNTPTQAVKAVLASHGLLPNQA